MRRARGEHLTRRTFTRHPDAPLSPYAQAVADEWERIKDVELDRDAAEARQRSGATKRERSGT